MDIRLHFIEQGDGFPLILLHGNGEDSGYFEHQMEPFSQRYRVIALDTRGHGQSPRGDRPFTIAQFAEDLRAFMDEQSIPRAHILGFSDGANIALAFALKHPERVGRLVLNGGNLRPGGVKPAVQAPIVLGYGLCALIARFDKRAVPKKELLGLMVTQPKLRPSDLAGLRMPTLVVAGTNDMIRESHTREIHRAISGSRLAILPGDHFVAHERPERFNAAVLEFLQEEETHAKRCD